MSGSRRRPSARLATAATSWRPSGRSWSDLPALGKRSAGCAAPRPAPLVLPAPALGIGSACHGAGDPITARSGHPAGENSAGLQELEDLLDLTQDGCPVRWPQGWDEQRARDYLRNVAEVAAPEAALPFGAGSGAPLPRGSPFGAGAGAPLPRGSSAGGVR